MKDYGQNIAQLLAEIRACTVCAAHLPLGPRPSLKASATSRIMIIGQAPGTKVHETGLSWNDPSGDRLREWMQVPREDFYDESRVALISLGLCYPGRYAKGGDLPPRPECAPLWHARLRALMPHLKLTLLLGQYAQRYYLGARRKKNVTETVRAFEEYLPEYFPLPHPSFRTTAWVQRNPWFRDDVLPVLRARVHSLIYP